MQILTINIWGQLLLLWWPWELWHCWLQCHSCPALSVVIMPHHVGTLVNFCNSKTLKQAAIRRLSYCIYWGCILLLWLPYICINVLNDKSITINLWHAEVNSRQTAWAHSFIILSFCFIIFLCLFVCFKGMLEK